MEFPVEDFFLVNDIRIKLQTGDLLFIKYTGFTGRLIRWITKKRYRHVALYIGDGRVLEAQKLRTVGYQNLSRYHGNYEVFHYQETMTDFQKMRILYFLRAHIGVPYSYMDHVMQIFRALISLKIPWQYTHRHFCSVLMKDAFLFAGLRMPAENVTLENLAKWEYFSKLN